MDKKHHQWLQMLPRIIQVHRSNWNHFNINLSRFRLSYLEEEGISQCIAQTKHKVFLGMFWDSLNNAVLHPDCMFVDAVVVDP